MNNSTAPARPQDLSRAREALLDRIAAERSVFENYLPPDVPADRFMRLCRDAVLAQPQLAECSVDSVLRSLARAAASGLPLDGKFSSLIVRKSKHGRPTATWDPSYRGLTSMALASGYVRDVQSYCVRERDEFRCELGDTPHLVHVPSLLPNNGPVIASYCIVTLTTGGRVIELLTRGDIDRIKAMSPAGASGPWSSWCDEMSRKSATRRALKRLPAAPARAMLPPSVPVPSTPIAPPARNGALQIADPEHEHVLTCSALERLSAAETLSELEARWAQTQIEYAQASIGVPVRVEASYHDQREALLQEDGER